MPPGRAVDARRVRFGEITKPARARSGSRDILVGMSSPTGQRLLRYDRRLGVRFVAGADEAGRGSLAGPLVVAGVLFDYAALHGRRTRPLALLNDSKQVDPDVREVLLRAVLDAAAHVSVRVIPACDIDRHGLHRSNLSGLRDVLADLAPRAEVCLVDGFRLGPLAPPHRAVVDGDTRSAAIAAASIVAKVTRDRIMRRLDALLSALRLLAPRRLHHARSTRRPCARTGRATSTGSRTRRSATRRSGSSQPRERGRAPGALALPPARLPDPRDERPCGPQRARPDRPAGAGAHVRRGEAAQRQRASAAPSAPSDAEKRRRVRRAAQVWLSRNPQAAARPGRVRGRRGRPGAPDPHSDHVAGGLGAGPGARSRGRRGEARIVAATQEALYRAHDLELSWSEASLPERERTKHVHRLHPYLGKFIPQLVETLLDRHVPAAGGCSIRSPARARRSCRRSSRATTPRASTSPASTRSSLG